METDNSTQDCIDGNPSAVEFFAGFQANHEFILLVPIVLCLMTLTMLVINLRAALERCHKDTKSNVATLLTIYPVRIFHNFSMKFILKLIVQQIVACSSLVAILVPRTFFFCDTISHISFVVISYQFYR